MLPSLDDGRPAFREIVIFPHIYTECQDGILNWARHYGRLLVKRDMRRQNSVSSSPEEYIVRRSHLANERQYGRAH